MARKPINKKTRQLVYEKFNGRCAYCGIRLPDRWHVDHLVPISHRDGTDDLSNLYPACPACNSFKTVMPLSQFRSELSFQLDRASQRSVNYRFAKKFGQVVETPCDIVFYFETLLEEI